MVCGPRGPFNRERERERWRRLEGEQSRGQEGLEVREGSEQQGKPGRQTLDNGETETKGEKWLPDHTAGEGRPGLNSGQPRSSVRLRISDPKGSPTLFSNRPTTELLGLWL